MSLRDKLFEPDKPKPAKVPLAAPVPAASTQAPPSNYQRQNDVTSIPTETSGAYAKLKAKTDFDQTDAGKTLKKFLAPIENLPLDEAMKAKTAMAQAQANNGLTVQAVLNAFAILQSTLGSETQQFNQLTDRVTAQNITARQQKIDNLKKQVEDCQQQMIQLSTEMAESQEKISHAKTEFASAAARRSSELEQQREHYANLLQ